MRDKDLRDALRDELFAQHGCDRHTVILEEFAVCHGSARIDLAVVNGLLHGFELKSDSDTLSRLPQQIRAFAPVFDRVTLVLGERHIRQALELIPEWWGVRLARTSCGRMIFRDLKLPLNNPQAEPRALVRLLWREEAVALLRQCGSRTSGRQNRADVYEEIVQKVQLHELRSHVRESIKGRRFVAPQTSYGDLFPL